MEPKDSFKEIKGILSGADGAPKSQPADPLIELAPRSGLPPAPSEPAQAAKSSGPAARGGIPSQPPMELNLPKAVPASAPPPAAQAQGAGAESVKKEQLRSLAFLYASGQHDPCAAFARSLHHVALKVSKKPFYVRAALALEVGPGAGPAALLASVKASSAVGAILWLSGIPDAQAQEIEHAFSGEGIFLRSIAPEQAQKRVFSMDLLLDIMLLEAG